MTLAAINTSGWNSFFQLMGVLLIFVFVLALTYFCTRWIARYQKGISANKNIRVIETFRLTNNKYIQILAVGQVCLVIAVCKDTVTLLCEMTEDELAWLPDKDGQSPVVNENFQEILQKLKNKLPRK